jgi:biotin operon repressor
MSDPTPLKLKNPKNWFAAGEEMRKAVILLTDGAFKIFVYICLHAHRGTGTLETSQTELARKLNKSQGNIRKNLRELQSAGMCNVNMTQNRHIKGTIEITPEYWPYDRDPGELPKREETVYLDAVKKLLSARACVRPSFSIADERLAREWFDCGIPLDQIEQAVLVACSRKYIAWRNGQSKTPINSLRYFESTLEELRDQKTDPEYWNFIRFRMQRVEKLWLQNETPSSTPGPEPDDVKDSEKIGQGTL